MNFWDEQIKIGARSYSRFMAAPLDGVTDSPLRQLIRDFSPEELLFTEMRHVASVANERTGIALRYKPVEQPLCFQVSANRDEWIEESIERVIEAGFIMFNLNIGCPAKNVIKNGSGSALMADIPRMEMLLNRMQKSLNGRIPLTVKIRAGFKERNAVEVAKAAEACGAEMLIIHPRTQPEGFTSRLDFDSAAAVKKALKIPVVFSGNLNNFERCKKTYELTGVDGFMIGRALWGCPWKMAEIRAASRGEEFNISVRMAVDYAFKHFQLNREFYGPHGFNHFKKQLPQYIRSVVNAAEIRYNLLRTTSEEAMEASLIELTNQNLELQA